jgi:hypothetical protein
MKESGRREREKEVKSGEKVRWVRWRWWEGRWVEE